MRGGSIAIFVKTPGLSPVKTRLAEGIGRDQAEAFHPASAAAVAAVAKSAALANGDIAFLAVAGEAGPGSPTWKAFQRFPKVLAARVRGYARPMRNRSLFPCAGCGLWESARC